MELRWVPLTSKMMQKKLLVKSGLLVVTELFNIAVNYFDAKKSACCSQVLFITKLVSGTQCKWVTEMVIKMLTWHNYFIAFAAAL